MDSRVKVQKFHKIFDDLAVALEASFPYEARIECLGDFNPEENHLIFRSPAEPKEEQALRIYFPAKIEGSLISGKSMSITFIPWVDETAENARARFHRLIFRLKKTDRRRFRWIRFARADEDSTFSFDLSKPFFGLDFFGKSADRFNPLFFKIVESGRFAYYVVRGGTSESRVVIDISRIEESRVPLHLALDGS